MAAIRWLVVLVIAVAVGMGTMAVATTQLRPDPKPCLDNIDLQPQANSICTAPETPDTTVYGIGAAGAALIAGGLLLYRRGNRDEGP